MLTLKEKVEVGADGVLSITAQERLNPGLYEVLMVVEDITRPYRQHETELEEDVPEQDIIRSPLVFPNLRFPGWSASATFSRDEIYGDDEN